MITTIIDLAFLLLTGTPVPQFPVSSIQPKELLAHLREQIWVEQHCQVEDVSHICNLKFPSSHIKKNREKGMDEINFNNTFYLTHV